MKRVRDCIQHVSELLLQEEETQDWSPAEIKRARLLTASLLIKEASEIMKDEKALFFHVRHHHKDGRKFEQNDEPVVGVKVRNDICHGLYWRNQGTFDLAKNLRLFENRVYYRNRFLRIDCSGGAPADCSGPIMEGSGGESFAICRACYKILLKDQQYHLI